MKLNKVKNLIIFGFGYLILAIVFTYPLVHSFRNHIPNNMFQEAGHTFEYGDQLQILAGFREHKNIVKSFIQGQPFYAKELCMGDIQSCELSTLEVVTKFVFSSFWLHTLFNVFLDDVEAYNTVILLSFILTGYSAYYFLSYFVSKSVPSKLAKLIIFLASLFMVLAPLRLHQLFVGHKNGFLYPLLILLMGLIERILANTNQKNTNIYKFVSGLILIYLGFAEQLLMLCGLIYLTLRIIWYELVQNNLLDNLKQNTIKITWEKTLNYVWLLITVILTYLFNVLNKISDISSSTASSGRSIEEIRIYSAQITHFFQSNNLLHEQNVYLGLGIGLILLALLSVYKISKNQHMLIFALLTISIVIILSMGANTPIYKLIYEYVPFIKFSRTPARFAFLIYPLLGLLWVLLCNSWYNSNLKNKLKKLYLLNIAMIVFLVINFYSFKDISLSPIPNTAEGLGNNQKILFLPMTEPGHFFGSVYEFQLSQVNSVSVNGYDPFPSIESQEFYDKYGLLFNSQAKFDPEFFESEQFQIIKDKYHIDKVIILDQFINSEIK